MIDWTDAQMDEMFLRSEARPLDGFLNAGEHQVDLDAHEIYNDQRWKGFMPKGLPATEATARLSLGFAKKLWKAEDRVRRRNPVLRRHDCDEAHGQGNHPRSPDPRPAARPLCPAWIYRPGVRAPVLRPPETDQRRPHAVPRLHRAVSGRQARVDRPAPPPVSVRANGHRRSRPAVCRRIDADGRGPSRHMAPRCALLLESAGANRRSSGSIAPRSGPLQIDCDTSSSSQGFLLPKFVSEHFQTEHLPTLQSELRTVDRRLPGRQVDDRHSRGLRQVPARWFARALSSREGTQAARVGSPSTTLTDHGLVSSKTQDSTSG